MKKMIAALLIFGLLLTLGGCAQQADTEPLFPYKANLSLSMETVMEEGMFIYAGAFVTYLDFETAQALPYCARPSCQHNTPDCDAWACGPVGDDGALTDGDKKFILGDKLYTLEKARQVDNPDLGEPGPEATLKVSRLDGSGEKTAGSIRGDSLQYLSLTLYGDSAYATTYVYKNLPGVNKGSMESYGVCYLTEIDLKKGKVVNETKLAEGYAPMAGISWIYNGYAYLDIQAYEEPLTEAELLGINATYDWSTQEYYDKLTERCSVKGWFRMDLKTGELTPWEDGYPAEYGGPHAAHDSVWNVAPVDVWQDWCLYREDDQLKAWNMQTGEDRVVCDGPYWGWGRYGHAIGQDALYFKHDADSSVYRYDFETEETVEIPTTGLTTELLSVIRKTDNYLFAIAREETIKNATGGDSPLGENFYRMDITNGIENGVWEKIEIEYYAAGTTIDMETKETRITITPWDQI